MNLQQAFSFVGKELAAAGPGQLPSHDAKARFQNGDKVELPALFGRGIIWSGVVTGYGTDDKGEYQEVNVNGETKRVRLMDLKMLRTATPKRKS